MGEFYNLINTNIYHSPKIPDDPFNGLLLVDLRITKSHILIQMDPNSLVNVLSIFGGFIAMITRVIGLSIRSYQQF